MLVVKNLHINLDEFELRNINLKIEKGDYFILLGESGSGKSILLESLAGIKRISSGSIFLNDIDITNIRIQDRNIGIVFQDFAVFPNMSVKENLSFPLKSKKKSKSEIIIEVNRVAELVNISHLLHRMPDTLSGGELQRVAIGRVLALDPEILLLDEPFSSLDNLIGNELQTLLRKLNRAGQTIIHVTHDYQEALSLAKNIAIIHDGEIIQSGSPNEVFHNPSSHFVASFTGVANFYKAERLKDNIYLVDKKIKMRLPNGMNDEYIYISFGMSDVILSASVQDNSVCNQLNAEVIDIIPSENGVNIVLDTGIKIVASVTEKSVNNLNIKIGSKIVAGIKATALRCIPIRN